MQFQQLTKLDEKILHAGSCNQAKIRKPVINELRPSQKYLIISLEPSSDTDKSKPLLEPHSSFEERVIALFFLGSDSSEAVEKVQAKYGEYKDKFLDNFYWTHYSKCYTGGNPDSFWADNFLLREIELFEPKLIIIFGNTVANFLFGRGKLIDRVNKVLEWNKVPVICTLHPSRNWNLRRRPEYSFKKTWELIRSKTKMD